MSKLNTGVTLGLGESLNVEPGDEVVLLEGVASVSGYLFQAPITLGFGISKWLKPYGDTVHLIKRRHSKAPDHR